jgi:ABC-type polysaccharide/polyol phosphate export permease
VIYTLPVGGKWIALLRLNPMYGPISAVRAAVNGLPINYESWLISTGAAVVIAVIGLLAFSRMERRFADVV